MLFLYRDDGCHHFLLSGKIKTIYHSPKDVGELHAFAGTLIRTLDVWDETHSINDGCDMCEILEPKEEGVDSPEIFNHKLAVFDMEIAVMEMLNNESLTKAGLESFAKVVGWEPVFCAIDNLKTEMLGHDIGGDIC